jgi:NADPH-dependent 2,4-dienoyl-CoA reductase/sulfur reductase-like enzyme/rhodanese-related sulfurtransferase
VRHEVTRIDRGRKEVEVLDHDTGGTYRLPYDKLILAPGASPVVPPIDHVRAANVFLLRSMEDTRAVDRWLRERRPRSAVIVGAGFIGLEMAEAMRERGLAVTVVEKAPHVLPPIDSEMAAWVAKELQAHGVKLVTGKGLKALHAKGGLVGEVEIEDGRRVPADVVLLSIGVRPNVTLAAEAKLTIGTSGAIEVDGYQRTNDPDVYAVGDAAEVVHGVTGQAARIPLAGPANRQGRLAGEHAATGDAPRAGTVLGTAIVQVFGVTVGVTGLSEAAARRAGLDVDTAYAIGGHHAGYYPGAKQLRLKLVYEKPTGRVVGAQVVGAEGVDKRIDTIATAMNFGATVDDLASLDLAYAPQFGSAKDPVHIVAMVARNQRSGVMPAISVEQVSLGEVLVDVRAAGEYAEGTLPGSINIPLDELRRRARELDPKRSTVVFCGVGQRGYVAQRILRQMGFADVKNLKGGVTVASQVVPLVKQQHAA